MVLVAPDSGAAGATFVGSRFALASGLSQRFTLRALVPAVVAASRRTAARALQPDAILLGGDLLDLPWQAGPLYSWLRELQAWRPIYAVPGNHDRWAGLRRLKRHLDFLHWLDEQPLRLENGLRLCGCPGQGADAVSLLVAHEPARVGAAARAGFPVVLAGHHHGCQWIAFQHRGRDYPGAWFFSYHGPYFEVGNTRMWVSRGVNDQFPLRIGCPRDVLLVEVN